MRFQVKNNFWILVLLVTGSLSWSLTMIKSGLCWGAGCASGIGFWGANGHDGVWHIALINSLNRGSLNMPVFAGTELKNYHIGFDLLISYLHNLTQIPVSVLYFQVFPPIAAILVGVLTYFFVLSWKKSRDMAIWSTFFVYFAGSWGWVFTYFRNGQFGGESMFWSTQAISTLINPPFVLSLILILFGLLGLLKFQTKNTLLNFIFVLISFGVLIEIKAYAGILILLGLGVVAFREIVVKRNLLNKYSVLLTGSAIISYLLFVQLNQLTAGILIIKPFWFIETMMAVSDRVDWTKYYEAMINWRAAGIWYKAIPAYIIAILIFWFGNMGTRGLKEPLMLKWMQNFRSLQPVEILISTVMVAGLGFTLVFVQKGNPWNTIQFLYYSLFFAAICAGISTSEIIKSIKSKKFKNVLTVLIIILTIPTTLSNLWYIYLPSRPPAKISSLELEALNFLKNQPFGVVLTYPFDEKKALKAIQDPPRPLYLYDSTGYVSAFSNKDVYLEDEVNLDIMDYPWRERRKNVEIFYNSQDQNEIRQFLVDNNISYIYWIKGQRATLGETQLCIFQLFENKEVNIYKVGKISPDNCVLN